MYFSLRLILRMKNQNIHIEEFIFPSTINYIQLMFNSISDSIILLDRNFTIVECNKAACNINWNNTGVSIRPGVAVLDSIDSARRPIIKELMEDVLKGNSRKTEYIFQNNDGAAMYFENTIMPAKNDEEQIIGIIIISKDISAQKKSELAILEAEERWQFAFDASNQAAWDWNMLTGEIIYSSSYKKM